MAEDNKNTRCQLANRTAERPADRNRCGTLGNVTEQNEQRLFRTHRAVRVRQTGVAAAVLADVVPEDEVGYHERAVEAAEEIGQQHHQQYGEGHSHVMHLLLPSDGCS